jgi:hypothetical protein
MQFPQLIRPKLSTPAFASHYGCVKPTINNHPARRNYPANCQHDQPLANEL